MATAVQTMPAINGTSDIKLNGKVKSKNQLRRLKQKQKKVVQATQVRQTTSSNACRH